MVFYVRYFYLFFFSVLLISTSCGQGDERVDFETPFQKLDQDFQGIDDFLSAYEQGNNGGFEEAFDFDGSEDEVKDTEIDYYKELIKSKRAPTYSFMEKIAKSGNYLFSDLMVGSLLLPFYRFSLAWKDAINHHVIDPVRKGDHYFRYMDSVMLGTFDNRLKESTGGSTWIRSILGAVFKNVIGDFKLGSEVRRPGVIDSKYHNHPVTVKRLGAETGDVARKMSETHEHELVVIDVVKPFMLALDFVEDTDDDNDEFDDEMVEEYEISDENNIYGENGEYKIINDYEDKRQPRPGRYRDSAVALLYKFFYATKKLVTDVNHPVEFEETEYFKRTGRYEESDRTFLFQWNKGVSKQDSFRSGQVVRVDRKGYFSMGPIPLAWNYCEILLHEGGTKNKKVLVQRHQKELIYESREFGTWGIRKETIKPVERIKTIRKKVIKQVPNVNKFRVYTENLCQAAEASVRSRSEVIVYTTERSFSWFVPSVLLSGELGISAFYRLARQNNINYYYRAAGIYFFGVALAAYYYPSILADDVPNTIHSIKFPPPDDY